MLEGGCGPDLLVISLPCGCRVLGFWFRVLCCRGVAQLGQRSTDAPGLSRSASYLLASGLSASGVGDLGFVCCVVGVLNQLGNVRRMRADWTGSKDSSFHTKLSGNNFFYIASSLLVIVKRSCSELRCQIFGLLSKFASHFLASKVSGSGVQFSGCGCRDLCYGGVE